MNQLKPLMESVFRQSDFLVRWGGSEFLLVGRFSEREAAPVLAERLRHAIAEHLFKLPNKETVNVTCSVGFSVFPFVPKAPLVYSWTQVVDIATMCLYAAKKSSKNAWVGLSSDEDADTISYQKVISQPQASLDKGQLKLYSSLSHEDLDW